MSMIAKEFNLADYYLFDRIDDGMANRTAIRFGERTYSYGDVAIKTRKTATLMAESGLNSGDRVYLILPDMPPFAWAFFGLHHPLHRAPLLESQTCAC